MSSPQPHDPSTARFRRGAGRPVGPPGPPPARVRPLAEGQSPWGDATEARRGESVVPADGDRPISLADVPVPGDPVHPAPPPGAPPSPFAPSAAFGGRVAPADTFGERLAPLGAAWPDVDVDPGRRIGVVAIVVGFFAGLVGVFIGIASIRASRRVGLPGRLGTAAIVVSVLNIVIGGAIGISWVRHEVSLQQQCSLVGPGQYLTQSGDRVTCH